jgi:hypothetical protein
MKQQHFLALALLLAFTITAGVLALTIPTINDHKQQVYLTDMIL